MQADHDAIEMMLDAYSADGWDMIRTHTAAISAMMMLIEREDVKSVHLHSTHPKAATRIFQLIGHVIEMPLMQAMLAQRHPELDISSEIPSDEEQSSFNRHVVIPSFFDAVSLARIANADAIAKDLGEAQEFFRDVQIAKLSSPEQSNEFTTQGAKQWHELLPTNEMLMRAR
jgi:dihydroxyacetone kinase-like predicted kinase